MNGTIRERKSMMAAIAGVVLALFVIAAHGQNPAYPTESSRIRPEGSTPTPPPGPDTGGKVNVKTADDIDAEARAKGRKETMVIEAVPSKRSTPSPEFAGSLLDAGLTKMANKKESAKAPVTSSSPSTKPSPIEKSAAGARPNESPSVTLKLDQTEAPSLSLGITPKPSATP
jgi:hypothetical protein